MICFRFFNKNIIIITPITKEIIFKHFYVYLNLFFVCFCVLFVLFFAERGGVFREKCVEF